MKNHITNSVMVAAGLLAIATVGTFTLASTSWGQVAQNTKESPASSPVTVIIDAGHGGSDAGATARNVSEKNINLAVARQLRGMLESEGIRVILTRSDDSSKSIEDRVTVTVHQKPTCFISIHCEPKVTGYSVVYHDNSASGKKLAGDIALHNAQTFGQASGKIDSDSIYFAKGLGVLRKSSPVSAAVMVNCPGVVQMASAKAQSQVALAIAAGVHDFANTSASAK